LKAYQSLELRKFYAHRVGLGNAREWHYWGSDDEWSSMMGWCQHDPSGFSMGLKYKYTSELTWISGNYPEVSVNSRFCLGRFIGQVHAVRDADGALLGVSAIGSQLCLVAMPG